MTIRPRPRFHLRRSRPTLRCRHPAAYGPEAQETWLARRSQIDLDNTGTTTFHVQRVKILRTAHASWLMISWDISIPRTMRCFRASPLRPRVGAKEETIELSDIVLARVMHVLAVVLWIGGVGMVTTVLLPSIRLSRTPPPSASPCFMPLRHDLPARLELPPRLQV